MYKITAEGGELPVGLIQNLITVSHIDVCIKQYVIQVDDTLICSDHTDHDFCDVRTNFTLLYTLVQTCVINFVYLFTLYIHVHVPTYMYIMDCKGGNPVSATGVGSNGPWELNRSPRLEVAFRPYVSGNFLA